jgi:hypothetical protein
MRKTQPGTGTVRSDQGPLEIWIRGQEGWEDRHGELKEEAITCCAFFSNIVTRERLQGNQEAVMPFS